MQYNVLSQSLKTSTLNNLALVMHGLPYLTLNRYMDAMPEKGVLFHYFGKLCSVFRLN